MRPSLSFLAICTCLTLSAAVRADMYSDVNALVQSGQWSKAQALADTRLQSAPADPQMRLLQSRIQTGLGQTQAAMETLRALIQSYPELPEPYNNLAVLLVRENRLTEALQALQTAVQVRPDYALALENLGDIHLALAIEAYAQAMKSAPMQGPVPRIQNKKTAAEQALKTP